MLLHNSYYIFYVKHSTSHVILYGISRISYYISYYILHYTYLMLHIIKHHAVLNGISHKYTIPNLVLHITLDISHATYYYTLCYFKWDISYYI